MDARLGAQGKIIDGHVDGGHGYVVAIGYGGVQSGIYACSGTLISQRTVVTAFHCVDPNIAPPPTHVFFGDVVTGQGTVVPLTAPPSPPAGLPLIELPNAIAPDTAAILDTPISHAVYDLAFLMLDTDAPVQPATLLRETMTNDAAFVGPHMTFVGFGTNNSAVDINGACGSQGSGTKRVTTYPLDEVGVGQQVTLTDIAPVTLNLDPSLVLYYEERIEVAPGDSGGPMFALRGGVERHAAVTSFGVLQCQVDQTLALPGPGWGTESRTDGPIIDTYIQSVIDGFEGSEPCRADGSCNPDCQVGQADLVDPDCAEQHCAADGVCAIACVAPLDPDCRKLGVNHCGVDGVCDFECQTPDPDCATFGVTPPQTASSTPASSTAAPKGNDGGVTCQVGRTGAPLAGLWWLVLGLGLGWRRRHAALRRT
ncbi:MAG: trypsin-like serine protease [Polyangiales bacterium]